MRSKTIVSILLLLVFFTAIAQEPVENEYLKLDPAPFYKRSIRTEFTGGFFEHGDKVYAFRTKENKWTLRGYDLILEKFDSNYNLLQQSDGFFPGKGVDRTYKVLGFCSNAEGDLCIATISSAFGESVAIDLFIVNMQTLEPGEDYQRVLFFDEAFVKDFGFGKFELKISPDKSLYALLHTSDFDEDKAKLLADAYVFNSNWELLHKYSDEVANTSRLADLKDWALSNDGKIDILLKVYNSKREEISRNKANYQLWCRRYEAGKINAATYKIDLGENFILGMDLENAVNGDMVIGANVYGIEGGSPKKVLCLRVSPAKDSVYPFQFVKLDSDSLEKDLALRSSLAKFKAFERPKVKCTAGGGVYIISERVFEVNTVLKERPDQVQKVSYYNLGLSLSYFGENEVNWTKFIRKLQVTFRDGGKFNSYAMALNGERLHLFYINSTFFKVTFKKFHRPLRHEVFDPNGERIINRLFSCREFKVMPLSKLAFMDSKGQFIIPINGNKKTAMLVINFK
jgi:hypothetical protein